MRGGGEHQASFATANEHGGSARNRWHEQLVVINWQTHLSEWKQTAAKVEADRLCGPARNPPGPPQVSKNTQLKRSRRATSV